MVWEGKGNYGPAVMNASRSPGRDWTSPRRIDGRRQLVVTGPDVGIDAAGEAVAVWQQLVRGKGLVVKAAARPGGR